jgi:hypothetical protein
MKERRSLVDGLNPVTPDQEEREKAFVYGIPSDTESAEADETKQTAVSQPPVPTQSHEHVLSRDSRLLPQFAGRVPITTRTRPEIASEVKRASLTRQLDGVTPYSVQDIVEEALELWLLTNGYLQR